MPPVEKTVQSGPPAAAEDDDFVKVFDALDDTFLTMRRAARTYDALHGALLSLRNKLPEGERRRGLPIFEMPIGGGGADKVERVCLDLKQLNSAEAEAVLVPLINMAYRTLVACSIHLHDGAGTMRRLLVPTKEE